MSDSKWIILNDRLQKADKREFDTAAEAQRYLDRKYLNNPMAKMRFFVADKSRYNY